MPFNFSLLDHAQNALADSTDWRGALESLWKLLQKDDEYRGLFIAEADEEEEDAEIVAAALKGKFSEVENEPLWHVEEALWNAALSRDMAKDLAKIAAWTEKIVAAFPKGTKHDTLWFDLGDAPDTFAGRAVAGDPKKPCFLGDTLYEDDAIGASIAYLKPSYSASQMPWKAFHALLSEALWMGFATAAAREALKSAESAAKALGGRERMHVMAGFEGATRYIGTLLPGGWTWDKRLAKK